MNEVIIVGAGGHAKVCDDIILKSSDEICVFYDGVYISTGVCRLHGHLEIDMDYLGCMAPPICTSVIMKGAQL